MTNEPDVPAATTDVPPNVPAAANIPADVPPVTHVPPNVPAGTEVPVAPDHGLASASADGVYALLTDGTTVLIRPASEDDSDAVRQMHAEMSPGNVYLRFFSISPSSAAREARRVCRPPDLQHAALLAWLGSQLIGVASYEPTSKPGVAEIAFAVSDQMHGRGVAT